MAYNLKEVAKIPDRITGGHRMCAGCGAPVVVRHILRALKPEEHAVICCATGCLEVSTFLYPYTAWMDSFIHSAFENAAATLSGVEAAYLALKRREKISRETRFIAFAGDGGTADIGLQSLSGAVERGHRMLYVCYDNGAYMNTGAQRSSATPLYADTTTTPVGTKSPGKLRPRKDMTGIMVSHGIPYAAQTAAVSNMKDLYLKAVKALQTDGPSYLNVLAPCPRGWQYDTPDLMEINRLAVETCFWPLYEVEKGRLTLSYQPRRKLPVEEFLKKQARFKHLFREGGGSVLQELQNEVDQRWENLLKQAGK